MNASLSRLLMLLAFVSLFPRMVAEESLEAVEKSASEWVKLRLETTRLDTEWRSEHELMTSIVAALKERAVALEEKRDATKAKTAKDREELEATRQKNKAGAEDFRAFEARLKELGQKLIALRPSLPPRLSNALELSYRSLASTEIPIGERMQIAMTVLNRCAQFNRLVTAGDDVLTLEGEPSAKSFEVIYWGLSHGYALDRMGRKAWLGQPGPTGWRWELRPEAYESVVQLVAIANDKADPDFVSVPAHVARSVSHSAPN